MTNPRSHGDMSGIRGYIAVLRRRKWTVLLTVVVAVAAMTAYVIHETPVYEGTAQLQLTPQISSAVLQANNASINSAGALVDVPTDIQVIESASLENRVRGLIPNAPGVTVSQIGTTNVVSLSVRATDPRLAAKAANAYAAQYVALERGAAAAALASADEVIQSHITTLQTSVEALQAQLAHASGPQAQSLGSQLSSLEETQISLREELTVYQTAAALTTGGGSVVGAARVPTTPVKPKPVEYIILAAMLGLFAGAALALLQDKFDDQIRMLEDVEATLGSIPTLGVIPALATRRRKSEALLVARDEPRSTGAEAYRILRTAIRFLAMDGGVQLIQITSPQAGDGKTTTLANLAVTMAQAGQRVIVVDCDLRRPQLHTFFGIPNDVGFTSMLLSESPLEDGLKPAPGIPNLQILPSGPVPPFPSELLSSSRVDDLLRRLAEDCDVVLVDSPPVLPVADATVLAAHVDAVILVSGAGVSNRREIAAALSNEARVQAPVRGYVLNRVSDRDRSYYAYYGGNERNADPEPVYSGTH